MKESYNKGFAGNSTQSDTVSSYGYRYYSPELGRWINRDPLGEDVGANLTSFVFNNSLSGLDLLGLSDLPDDEINDLTVAKRIRICFLI